MILGDRQVWRVTTAESELRPPGHPGLPREALARDVEHGGRVAHEDVERPLRAPPYLETFYNPRRRHSALGQISPAAFETKHALKTGTLNIVSPAD